ncbi:MAG: histidinol phosphate phosphatase [Enterococcus sp.]
MHYYDQHLHTYFSFDSTEQFENYLTHQSEYFVSTEHFDLKNPGSQFQDEIPDYHAYQKKLADLSERFDTRFLSGIEIGVVPGQEEQIIAYLEQHPYDLKLVSIHQNGKYCYMGDSVLQKDKFAVAKEYFEQMATVLDTFHEGQVLTHFDYGLRRLDFTVAELQQFEGLLTQIFKKVIALDMAFELNGKSFLKYNNAHLYHYAVPLYQSVGGKLFTLGSDGHSAPDYQNGFVEMATLLKEQQVNELVVFQGNERYFTPLPLLKKAATY